MNKQKAKIWLITGVSSGFGKSLVDKVIAAGDIPVGTLRKPQQIAEFEQAHKGEAFAIRMDVTKQADIDAGVKQVLAQHGRIDVLVNNAGYGLFGAIEEVSEKEARDQMETNFFGALALSKAVLPAMRKQQSGHIVQVSSVGGFRSFAGVGLYNASKFALEGFSEALAYEVAPLGIKVMIVEPGPFRTDWAGRSAVTAEKEIADYKATAHATRDRIQSYSGQQPGDPDKAAALIIEAINAGETPMRLPLGQVALEGIRSKIESVEKDVKAWEKSSLATAYTG